MSEKHNKWNDKEEAELMKLISDNKPLEIISKKIKRSEKNIIRKLKKIALNMIKNNKNKEEILSNLKFLSESQIKRLIIHEQKKNNSSSVKSNIFSELSLKVNDKKKHKKFEKSPNNDLTKIYNILQEINKKIDTIIINKSNNNFQNKYLEKSSNISSQKSQKNIIHKSNNDKINNKSSSELTSGGDTDEILNLIKKKSDNYISAREKYNQQKKNENN